MSNYKEKLKGIVCLIKFVIIVDNKGKIFIPDITAMNLRTKIIKRNSKRIFAFQQRI